MSMPLHSAHQIFSDREASNKLLTYRANWLHQTVRRGEIDDTFETFTLDAINFPQE